MAKRFALNVFWHRRPNRIGITRGARFLQFSFVALSVEGLLASRPNDNCAEAVAQLAALRREQQLIERERDEARRRFRQLQTGLDDAIRRLQGLRQ